MSKVTLNKPEWRGYHVRKLPKGEWFWARFAVVDEWGHVISTHRHYEQAWSRVERIAQRYYDIQVERDTANSWERVT